MSEAPSLRRAFFWSAVDRFGQLGLQFILGIFMARLLTPVDFGLVGMLTVFFGVAIVLEDAGFGAALIQRKQVTDNDETSVFWLNVSFGVILTLCLCVVSPVVARFFGQPMLQILLCVLSLQVCIQSFSLVQVAILARNLDFRTAAIANTGAILLSGGMGIGMAASGCGVWSLVCQKLAAAVLRTSGYWLLSSWRPRGEFSWSSIRSLWSFGSNLLASGLLDSTFSNIYNVILGRLDTAQTVGQFANANQLQQVGATMTSSVLGSVMFPQFSRHQEDKQVLKAEFRRSIRIVSSFHFPIMAGLSACACTLVVCLFTSKWAESSAFLKVLSFVGMLYPIHALHLHVLKAQGRSDLHFRLEIIKVCLVLAVLSVTWKYGIMAIAVGALVQSILACAINGFYSRRLLKYNWAEQVKDLIPAFVVSLLAVLPASLMDQELDSNKWFRFFMQVFVSVSVYFMLVFLLRKSIFKDSIATIVEMFRKVFARIH